MAERFRLNLMKAAEKRKRRERRDRCVFFYDPLLLFHTSHITASDGLPKVPQWNHHTHSVGVNPLDFILGGKNAYTDVIKEGLPCLYQSRQMFRVIKVNQTKTRLLTESYISFHWDKSRFRQRVVRVTKSKCQTLWWCKSWLCLCHWGVTISKFSVRKRQVHGGEKGSYRNPETEHSVSLRFL